MMSPTAPLANKQLIWHTYSAQAYSVFHGDLDLYFGGWDGRSRVASIDTQSCPVYMLTGITAVECAYCAETRANTL
jgi:hypothetical protein